MAKATKPDTNRDELLKEVESLRAEIDSLKKTALPNNSLMEEMAKVRRVSNKQNNSNKIQVKDVDDHRNVKLYTPFNKCIEVHPNNAVAMMQYYYSKGVQLYTEKRTQEQVDEYRNRPDVMARLLKEKKIREGLTRKAGKNRFEEIAKAIAKETNKPIEELTKVLSKEQVGAIN